MLPSAGRREPAAGASARSRAMGRKNSDTGDEQMLITTTTLVEGRRVKEYLGLVSGEAILGANIFRDFFAGIRDVIGGRSAAYEEELRKAKQIAINEMVQEATARGGNAVI